MPESSGPNIVNVLMNLRSVAREKRPREKPLIIKTQYYENFKYISQEYNLFIYYAPFGHGKTYGIGLKLYHEALGGELRDIYNVVVLQLRNLDPESNPVELLKKVRGLRISPIEALLASSLAIGFSADRCGSSVASLCFSTYVERSGKSILDPDVVVDALSSGDFSLEDLVKRVSRKTGGKIVLVFDEFERLITEGMFVNLLGFRVSALDFFSRIASLMRRLYDRNVGEFKVVLLVQEAVLPKRIWGDLRNELKNTGAIGVTSLYRVEPYPASVYAEYVVEAISRLVEKNIVEGDGWASLLLGRNRYTVLLKKELEKVFAYFKQIPPRIAFSIADFYIDRLVKETSGSQDFNELRTRIREAYKETIEELKMSDEAVRLQQLYLSNKSLFSDRSSFGNKEYMSEFVKRLAGEILRCGKERGMLSYSTTYGFVCVEGTFRGELIVNVMLVKLKHSARTSVKRASEIIGKELAKRISELVEIFVMDKGIKGGIKRIRVNIYPVIAEKNSTAIYGFIVNAKRTVIPELGKRLSKALGDIFSRETVIDVDVKSAYEVNEMKAITLYTWLVSRESLGLLRDYIEKSYDEILSEMKNHWGME